MSDGSNGVGTAGQHTAARNLIQQLVENSDIHNEDDEELARQMRADEDEQQQSNRSGGVDDQFVDDDRDGQDIQGGGGNESYTEEAEDPPHEDQVQAAFENFGQITEEILSEWKEMFSLFDFDNSGFISTDDLGTVLRGLGRNLTEQLIGTLINSYDANGSGKLDFPTFYRLMCENSPLPGPCTEKQVMLDFHVFDMYRDGLIPVTDLVHLLRNLGEPLTRDDVDNLLKEIYIDGDNKVEIAGLVKHMFRTSAPNPE